MFCDPCVAGGQCGMLASMLILVGLEAGGMTWSLLLTHLFFFYVAGCLGKDIRFIASKLLNDYIYFIFHPLIVG